MYINVKVIAKVMSAQTIVPITSEQIFSILSDKTSLNILKAAYSGLKASSTYYNHIGAGKLSKKQFYVRLKRLREAGLIEKQQQQQDGGYSSSSSSFYRTTTLGSLVYNSHIKTLEEALANYWQLKSIDILKSRKDFPAEQKELVTEEILKGSNLKNIVNLTHLSGFTTVKDFNHLIMEVIKLLDNAQNEIYFASRYHDPHVANKIFETFSKGVVLHILDGNPDQISVENRINAVLRTPPNKETFEQISNIIRSSRFDLKRTPNSLPASFLVIDGKQVLYETISYSNPEQFVIALVHYDDTYLAQQFINYFKLLSINAITPRILEISRRR
jgi:DNA-binding transcriptional ArsR family regulator